MSVVADVSSQKDVEHLIHAVVERFGEINVICI